MKIQANFNKLNPTYHEEIIGIGETFTYIEVIYREKKLTEEKQFKEILKALDNLELDEFVKVTIEVEPIIPEINAV